MVTIVNIINIEKLIINNKLKIKKEIIRGGLVKCTKKF